MIRNTQIHLRLFRSDESDFYQRCYGHAIGVYNVIDVEPIMTRITEKQAHRENTSSATHCDYYRVNVCSPFLGRLTEGSDQRFDNYIKNDGFGSFNYCCKG